jgi:Rha family phage regulatory protein
MKLVTRKGKEIITTSTIVADVFEMRHDNVLRTIESWKDKLDEFYTLKQQDHFLTSEEMIEETDEFYGSVPIYADDAQKDKESEEKDRVEFIKRYFNETTVQVEIGKGGVRDAVVYEMTEEGFSLIALSFNGPKADKFKIEFVEEFFRMRNQLLLIAEQNLAQKTRVADELFIEVKQLESSPTKREARERERLLSTVTKNTSSEIQMLKDELLVTDTALEQIITIANTVHDDANGDSYPRGKAIEKVMNWHYREMENLQRKGRLTGKCI